MKILLLSVFIIQMGNFAKAETITCVGKTNDQSRSSLDFELVIANKKDVISKRYFYQSRITYALQDGRSLIHGVDLDTGVRKKLTQLIYTGGINTNKLEINFTDGGDISDTILNYPSSGIINLKLQCDITGNLPMRPVCTEDIDKTRALFTAIRSGGDTDSIETAIACGADVNFEDENKCTPLMIAIDGSCGLGGTTYTSSVFNYARVIDTLISNGAYADTKDINLETPLLKATKNGLVDVYDSFIAAEANFDIQDKNGMTPLMFAAMTGNSTIVEQVLAGNPNRKLKNLEGRTAYDLAVHWGKEDVVELLRIPDTTVIIEGKEDGSCSPLEVKLKEGQVVEVKLKATAKMFKLDSLKLGLDLMADGNTSVTQIFTAINKGNFPFSCGFHGATSASQGTITIL